jgi:arylsulfatase
MSHPNIVLLTIDACRADHLSCYGYARETSPNIDEFAATGHQYENAFSVSTHTREGVHGMLTGEYPDVSSKGDYSLGAASLATKLAEFPHASAAFHSNPFVSRGYGFDEGFERFYDDTAFGRHKYFALLKRLVDKVRNDHYVRAAEINEMAREWLGSFDGSPFFLWNHYMDVHGPFESHGGPYVSEDVSSRAAQRLYRRATDDPASITEDEEELMIDLYDEEIRYVDEQVGAFLAFLDDIGELEDSLVVLTADHGTGFGKHGFYAHPRELRDELVRVPMVVFEGDDVESEDVEAPVSTLDVVPTVLDALGESRTGYPGESLLDVAANPDEHSQRSVFTQVRSEDDESRQFGVHTVDDSGVLEWDLSAREYEWLREPSTETLRADLEDHSRRRMDGSTDLDADQPDLPEDVEQRLKILGYK